MTGVWEWWSRATASHISQKTESTSAGERLFPTASRSFITPRIESKQRNIRNYELVLRRQSVSHVVWYGFSSVVIMLLWTSRAILLCARVSACQQLEHPQFPATHFYNRRWGACSRTLRSCSSSECDPHSGQCSCVLSSCSENETVNCVNHNANYDFISILTNKTDNYLAFSLAGLHLSGIITHKLSLQCKLPILTIGHQVDDGESSWNRS